MRYSYLPCHICAVDVCDDVLQFVNISLARHPKAGYEQQDDFHGGARCITTRYLIIFNTMLLDVN